MTEFVIKKLPVYNNNTHNHIFTIVFKKIMLDKPYYVRCNKKGNIVDLRKKQSYVDFLHADKLKQITGYYDISMEDPKSNQYAFDTYFTDRCYIKAPTKIMLNHTTLLQIAQQIISSKIMFISSFAGKDISWYIHPSVIKNEMCKSSDDHVLNRPYTFITKDLLGEDVPMPDRALKQIKAREDKATKEQHRLESFEKFIAPTLENIKGIEYSSYDQSFHMYIGDVQYILNKYIEEVIIPKFKEAGVQINIDAFKVYGAQVCRKIPLAKVKLDNIDDVE